MRDGSKTDGHNWLLGLLRWLKPDFVGVQAAQTTRFCRAANLIMICKAIPHPLGGKKRQLYRLPEQVM